MLKSRKPRELKNRVITITVVFESTDGSLWESSVRWPWSFRDGVMLGLRSIWRGADMKRGDASEAHSYPEFGQGRPFGTRVPTVVLFRPCQWWSLACIIACFDNPVGDSGAGMERMGSAAGNRR